MATQHHSLVIMVTATLMGWGITMPAHAQSAADSEDPGAIVVTARRVEERLQDVPISITVFTQAQIDNRNIVNAADLGYYTPSLSTYSRNNPEKASFVIRGFIQDLGTAPSVGVYFADVVGPRAGGSLTAGNGVGVGNLFDLQNVQVLKGPQGTLFGRNTTGGAVLVVPRKPTDKLEGYVEGSLGNYDMRRIQGVLNVPLADTFKIRVGVDRMTRDGYVHNHSGIGPERMANADFVSARLSVVAELNPELENYTIATYSNSNNDNTATRLVGCNNGQFVSQGFPATPLSPFVALCNAQVDRQNQRGDGWWDVENSEPNPIMHTRTWQVINTTTWRANDMLMIKNIASYAEFHETTRFSFYGDNFVQPNGQLAQTLIRFNNLPGYNNASQSTWTEELQFQGKSADSWLVWQAGGYYEASDPLGFNAQAITQFMNCQNSYEQLGAYLAGTQANISCPPSASGSISVPYQKTWYRSRGLYAQATYHLTARLALTSGIRYTWDRQTHRYDGVTVRVPTSGVTTFGCANSVRVTNPDGSAVAIAGLAQHDRCNVTFTSKSDKPTWLLDLDYKPNENLLLYAKWARGYRAGGVNSSNALLETWQPEAVDTYEAGAKASFQGSIKGYFNIAGFYNDFRNQQITTSLIRNPRPGNPFSGGGAVINVGKSRMWGVEVDSSITLFHDLRVDAGYTYLNAKVLDIEPFTIPVAAQQFFITAVPNVVKGGPLALTPKHRASITGTYTLPLDSSIGSVSLGATYVFTDKRVAVLSAPAVFGLLPSTKLVNLNVSWTNILGRPLDLSVFVTNLTNAKFPVDGGSAFGSFAMGTQTLNEPRMWGARLRYRFGAN